MSVLSLVYGRVARLRRSWYEQRPHARRRLDRPVISVGNLVVGGSGKTPVVAAIVRMLIEMGERPAVLSRGYARRKKADGVVVVSDGERVLEPVERSGDEPQMLARALPGTPVLVSPDRYLAGRLAESRFGCTVHILDDGFQHLQLARTIDVLLISPGDLAERVLPSGRLRERLDAARGADAVLVFGTEDDVARVSSAVNVPTAFRVEKRYGPLRPLGEGEAPAPAGARVLAVAGIARPERFFRALREQGWNVVAELAFPDHHWYTTKDLASINNAAQEVHARIVVTTEKDAVRVGEQAWWAALPMEVAIEPADTFRSWLRGVASPLRGYGETSVRFGLELALTRFVAGVVRLLPMTAVRACGGALGRAVYFVDGFHRRIALTNLAQAFPTRSSSEQRAVARAMFAHFGRLLLELIKFGALSDAQMLARIDSDGEERVQQAYQHGRGVLFFTGHFGYWEMQAIAQPLRARPVSVLARPLDNPHLHHMLEQIRTRTGNSVIYRQGAIRKVMRELAANRGVALLIDQHLHSADAVYVDFFNRPAATTSALAALALRTGAPVIPVFALPLPGGRYRFVYERPVPPPREDSPDAVREFTQRCTDVLEMYVRRDPSLWLWMHRRWRDRDPDLADEAAGADEAATAAD